MSTSNKEPDKRIQKMSALAKSFPCLQDIDHDLAGIDPWHPEKLDQWAGSPWLSLSTQLAASFLLFVWNPYRKWQSGYFDLAAATASWWDEEHRTVVADWIRHPWFP